MGIWYYILNILRKPIIVDLILLRDNHFKTWDGEYCCRVEGLRQQTHNSTDILDKLDEEKEQM